MTFEQHNRENHFHFSSYFMFFIKNDLISNHEGSGGELKEASNMDVFKFICDWDIDSEEKPRYLVRKECKWPWRNVETLHSKCSVSKAALSI